MRSSRHVLIERKAKSNILLLSSVLYLLRVYIRNVIPQLNIARTLSKVFMSLMLFFFFCAFTTLHYLLDYYQEVLLLVNTESNVSVVCLWSFFKTYKYKCNKPKLITSLFFSIYIRVFICHNFIGSFLFVLQYGRVSKLYVLLSSHSHCWVYLIFHRFVDIIFFCLRNVISTFIFYSV